MANRHLSRSIVLQSLFEWDFGGKPEDLKSIIDHNVVEFAPGHSDNEFMYSLAETVQRKQQVIDDIIVKAAPEWPLEKISNVDRSVLRMGLAELLFGDREQVPPKVAINEAIELAKTFGGENSGKFVNGVLGAVYKEIGEPGKDQISKPKAIKNKEPEEPIDISKLPVEAKAGGLIFTHHEGEVLVAIVHDVFGYWTLVKSGAEEGEKYEDTAVRSVKQKLGLDAKVIAEIGKIEYVASHPEKKKILKVVAYFLMEAPYKELELKSNGGLDKADWMKPEQLVDLTIYDDILPSIAKAIEIINSK
ncbi:MAG: Transcription antitermination protein NusB [Patescibacteria group bacterium]|jgi:N utilization substance protein B|nr:Transcription antitermination protein NusB [Patescibacteria group bacterium]